MADSRLPKRLAAALCGVDSASAVAAVRTSTVGVAAADATDDYSIPNRILHTSCTAEQLMEAARDVEPVYYAGHIIDYGKQSARSAAGRPGQDSLVLHDGLRRAPPVFGERRYQRVL